MSYVISNLRFKEEINELDEFYTVNETLIRKPPAKLRIKENWKTSNESKIRQNKLYNLNKL